MIKIGELGLIYKETEMEVEMLISKKVSIFFNRYLNVSLGSLFIHKYVYFRKLDKTTDFEDEI